MSLSEVRAGSAGVGGESSADGFQALGGGASGSGVSRELGEGTSGGARVGVQPQAGVVDHRARLVELVEQGTSGFNFTLSSNAEGELNSKMEPMLIGGNPFVCLAKLIGSESYLLRIYACYGLGAIGGAGLNMGMVFDILQILARDNDPNVRSEVCLNLGKIIGSGHGGSKEWSLLEGLAGDEDENVRKGVCSALGKIVSSGGGDAALRLLEVIADLPSAESVLAREILCKVNPLKYYFKFYSMRMLKFGLFIAASIALLWLMFGITIETLPNYVFILYFMVLIRPCLDELLMKMIRLSESAGAGLG